MMGGAIDVPGNIQDYQGCKLQRTALCHGTSRGKSWRIHLLATTGCMLYLYEQTAAESKSFARVRLAILLKKAKEGRST